jgi:hypothetical protein
VAQSREGAEREQRESREREKEDKVIFLPVVLAEKQKIEKRRTLLKNRNMRGLRGKSTRREQEEDVRTLKIRGPPTRGTARIIPGIKHDNTYTS